MTSQTVTIFGPNLNDDRKGTFHVHAQDCADCRKYGPGTKFGGDDHGWTLRVDSRDEVGADIDDGHIAEGSMTIEDAVADCYFAPCVTLPLHASEVTA